MPDPCLNPSPRISLSLVGATRALQADVVPGAAIDNAIQIDADGLYSQGLYLLPGGSSGVLPTGTDRRDGMTIAYRPLTGYRWTFQYWAGTTTSHAWEFTGGAPAYQNVETTGNIQPGGGVNPWHDLSASDVVGPDFVLPFDGTYMCRFGADIDAWADGNFTAVGLSVAGADPQTSAIAQQNVGRLISVSRTVVVDASHNQRLRLLYRTDGGPTSLTSTFNNRWMEVTPIRIG